VRTGILSIARHRMETVKIIEDITLPDHRLMITNKRAEITLTLASTLVSQLSRFANMSEKVPVNILASIRGQSQFYDFAALCP